MIFIIYMPLAIAHFVYMVLELRKQDRDPDYEESEKNVISFAYAGFLSAGLICALEVAKIKNGFDPGSFLQYFENFAMVLAIICLIPLVLRYHFNKI